MKTFQKYLLFHNIALDVVYNNSVLFCVYQLKIDKCRFFITIGYIGRVVVVNWPIPASPFTSTPMTHHPASPLFSINICNKSIAHQHKFSDV